MNGLLRKFQFVGSVSISNWRIINKLIAELSNPMTEIIKIEDHRDSFYQNYNPITKEALLRKDDGQGFNKLWSTYEKCRNAVIEYYDKVYIKTSIAVYDGNNMYGHTEKLRFILYMKLNASFIEFIKEDIEWGFERYLENEYEKYLERQKENWINHKIAKLLKDGDE